MSTIRRGKTGKAWGFLDDSGEIYYTKRGSNHFCFKYKGYGIQESLLDMLEEIGVEYISITTPKTTYKTPLKTWREHGIFATLREEDGPQVFLPLVTLKSVAR